MLRSRCVGASFAMIGLSIIPHAAAAQSPAPSRRQVGGQRIGGVPQQPQQQGPSLADLLDKVDWDPAARGTLLIVSPEETTHYLEHPRAMTPEDFKLAQAVPEAEANGQYRLARLTAYYNRKVVSLPTITVFAPATMAVLNTSHLPKPDRYAGMSGSEKARLLESTFTPDQWRQIASSDGIGAGDLKKDQRDIFLSMLPQPFVVSTPGQSTVDASGVSLPAPIVDVTLSEDQRESIRISMARKLYWTFKIGANGQLMMGDPNAGPKPRLASLPTNVESLSSVFGVSLVENVPSHSKPSQLPADWQALEKSIELDNAATVGDLIKRIAKQTGAELYCDPHYEDRRLYIRGASAQASDLCTALALGLTGTWRRLGEAFVLTDDLVGLGARHAVIDNWIRENSLLAQKRQDQADEALANSNFPDYIQWAADDPLKPSDALTAKINTQIADDGFSSLSVRPADLSTAAQEQIRRQIAAIEEDQQRRKEQSPELQPIETSTVDISVRLQPAYNIPGVGSVPASDLASNFFLLHNGKAGPAFTRPSHKVVVAPPSINKNAPAPPLTAFPSTLRNRVLLIGATTGMDLTTLAHEAHARGFTQLWISAKRGDTNAVRAVVKAGAANGLLVQAVLSLTRPAPADKPETWERNILGETLTDYAKRWRSQFTEMGLPQETGPDTSGYSMDGVEPTDAWRNAVLVDPMLQGGNFLRCDDPAAVEQVSADIARTASIAGLAGIVFRDIAAPGFDPPIVPSSGRPGSDPLLTMGYSDSMRLACLRKNGFDPIDISLLPSGDLIKLPNSLRRSGPMPEMALPFFPDSGTSPRNTRSAQNARFSRNATLNGNATLNRQAPTTQGTKGAWERWCAFRQDIDTKFVAAEADAAHAKSPALPIMVRRTYSPLDDEMLYFGSFEPPATLAAMPDAVENEPGARAGQSRNTLRDATLSASRIGYQSLVYDEFGGADEAKKQFVSSLPFMLRRAAIWDGVVIDFSDVSAARALELLDVFPNASAPAAPKPD